MTEQEWLTSTDPAAILRYLQGEPLVFTRIPQPSDRKLRLFAVACCRYVANVPMLQIAEENADGAKNWVEFTMAQDLIDEARDATTEQLWYLRACFANASVGATRAAQHPEAATETLIPKAALLRDIFGNPFQPVTLTRMKIVDGEGEGTEATNCDWITPTVLRLAQSIYHERAFERMPILADALEEAGCREEAVLRHLREQEQCQFCKEGRVFVEMGDQSHYGNCSICKGTGWRPLRGPHVRGCFALDLILGSFAFINGDNGFVRL